MGASAARAWLPTYGPWPNPGNAGRSVSVRRIDAIERRARLVRRHRLTPADRAGDGLEAARSVVVLHSSDPATVFLSVYARTSGVLPADIERALYDDRTLVRVLCMRRTLFVVPREVVTVVYAACTRTIAARERRRLEQMIAVSGISTRPAAWLARASTAALRAVEARGEAFTSEVVADVPVLAKRLRVGAGSRWEAIQSAGSRVLRQLAMEGRVVRGRPRGTWVNGQYRWVPTATWLGGDIDDVEKPEPWAVLLPTLDPTTMGWKERDWYLGTHGSVLFDSAGNAGPTVWWDGRVVGGWSQRRDGEIVYRLLE